MLPHCGQGAGQAMEDAYSLARCLAAWFEGDSQNLESFLKVYEKFRLPRTTAIQESSRESGNLSQQLGEVEEISDQQKKYQIMEEKLTTQVHWMWKYDVGFEIERTLKSVL